MFDFLEQQTGGVGSQPLSSIASYAQDEVSQTSKIHLTTDTNRNNGSNIILSTVISHHLLLFSELCLSITKAWIDDDDDVVGVVNALLPWRFLMSDLEDQLLLRESSYYFILSQNG